MNYVFPPAAQVALPIADSDQRFPVRRVYCVGRNYDAHVREMGGEVGRDPPFFFQKNPDDLVIDGAFPYPPMTEDVHHEVELVALLSEGGSDIAVDKALDHVFGYAVGVDFTRRDLQAEAKKLARPWVTAKAFAASGPIGPVHPAATVGHPASGAITLSVDGAERQSGDLADMIWSVPEIIAALSTFFELKPGDVIFTGTPSGVGPVVRGDRINARIDGLGDLAVNVV